MDRRQPSRAAAARSGHLRDARGHVHAGRNVAGSGRAARRAGAHRRHGHRDDADRGVPARVRCGLRRRRGLRALGAGAGQGAGPVTVFIVAGTEPQHTIIVRDPVRGGYGADALWNDDAHHAAVVALTGRREAYYRDYVGTAQELISCARFGYLYQGQWYSWQKKRRGTPALDLLPSAFVMYLENHDQVANSASGERLHQLTSPAAHRAMTGWMLLGPATPMLFQGQAFSSSAPFLFFADHGTELGEAVRRGRVEFLAQFPSLTDDQVIRSLAPPGAPATFTSCKPAPTEHGRHRQHYHRSHTLLT